MPEGNPDILGRFTREAASTAGFEPADGAVLALSGGPDSTALLDLFLRAGAPTARLVVAHLDHSMRNDSKQDALFVADQARAAGIRCRLRRRDVPALAGSRNIEARARELRYQYFAEVAADTGIDRVATGHHLDDQAETVLLRLMRGTGPGGLRSIPPSRPISAGSAVGLVRSLLPFRREEIVAYLAWRGLRYRIDSTNLDGSNLRSRVRTRLLPRLAREVPDLAARLAGIADRARLLPQEERGGTDGGLVNLTREARAGGTALREALRGALPPDGPPVDRAALDRVTGMLAAGQGAADLGRGWCVLLERGELLVLPPDGDVPWTGRSLPCPGSVPLPDGSVLTAAFARGDDTPVCDRSVEIVDSGAVPPPWEVRPAGEDGAFRPLGRDGETTILRFLKAQGVPDRLRRGLPVVWSGGTPVWVVGYRIDRRASIRPETARRAVLTTTSPLPPHP